MLKAIQEYSNSTELLRLTVQYQLLHQLKSYGLDPKEWQFQSLSWKPGPTSQASVVISHRQDDNLRIEGVAVRSQRKFCFYEWQDLKWDL